MAGAQGFWVRRFTSRRTGATMLVMLLCGKTPAMCAHRPENCYSSAGYDLVGVPRTYLLKTTRDHVLGEFLTGRFVKEESVGNHQLRIFWSWYGDGGWRAPDNPRWDFARLPALYKLYVIRETSGRSERLDDDPAVDLMRDLLPVLSRTLSAP